jgi:hypothetical protein
MALVPKVFIVEVPFSGSSNTSDLVTALNISSRSGVLAAITLRLGSSRVSFSTLTLSLDGETVFVADTQRKVDAVVALFGGNLEEGLNRLLFRLPFNSSVSLTARAKRDSTTGDTTAYIASLVFLNE